MSTINSYFLIFDLSKCLSESDFYLPQAIKASAYVHVAPCRVKLEDPDPLDNNLCL